MPEEARKIERPYDFTVAGHICFDIIPSFSDTGARTLSDVMTPGSLVQVGDAALSTGGPVSNTGIGLKIFGMNVIFMARIGDDEIGQIVINRLGSQGNAAGIHVSPGEMTSYTIAIAPPGLDRIFLHNPGTNNTFTSADVNDRLVKKSRHFHLGYPPLMRALYENNGAELIACFRKAKDAGATTSLDMSLPDPRSEAGRINWPVILEKLLPFVDIFLPSVEESMAMLEPEAFWARREKAGGADVLNEITPDEYSRIAKTFLRMGCRMTALKSAHRGFYFRTGSRESFELMGAARPADPDAWAEKELWAPAHRVHKMGSATGSGDSSIAGFLTAFLRGYSLEKCLRCANIAGWLNLQSLDALSGLRPWADIESMLASNTLQIINPGVKADGWSWDPDAFLHRGPCA